MDECFLVFHRQNLGFTIWKICHCSWWDCKFGASLKENWYHCQWHSHSETLIWLVKKMLWFLYRLQSLGQIQRGAMGTTRVYPTLMSSGCESSIAFRSVNYYAMQQIHAILPFSFGYYLHETLVSGTCKSVCVPIHTYMIALFSLSLSLSLICCHFWIFF